MRYMRRKGHNIRNIIIIADSSSTPFINYFVHAKDWGYHLVAILTQDNDFQCKFNEIRIIRNELNFKDLIFKYPIDDIFFCLPIDDKTYDLEKLIRESDEIGISLHIMQKSFLEDIISNSGRYNGLKDVFITHKNTSHNYIGLKLKDLMDIVFSIFTLIFISPVLGLIAILIKLEDGGPVLFKQERIGLNGRRFFCFKFRSMIVDAEKMITELEHKNEADGPVFKIEKDPRITKIGRILRKTSLDELPQFYNVIKGDMSIVGPRPPLLSEVIQYKRTQLRRLSMKPGITCSWQVWGRHQVTFNEWMKMDLDYIDNWSLWVDFKIMIATVGVIVKAKGQ
jgi:exopolysaccharide biosynthesis polyprenyl glycosylphosphotransferase